MPYKEIRSKPTGIPGIRQDGPNRFLVRIRWNDPKTGRRRKRQGVAPTLAKAVALREELRGQEVTPKPTRQRFAAYSEQWIEVAAIRLAPATSERYARALAHATVGLGQIFVDALQPSDVRRWANQQLRRHQASTVNSNLRILRVALDDAVADGLLVSNPARLVKTFPEGRTQGRRGKALTLEEFRTFTATAEELAGTELSADVCRLILTLAWTGMRKGEVLALKWSDYIDGELRVERSVFKRQEKTTKTDDPRRITVVEPLRAVLAAQRRWLLEEQHPGLASGLVFPASPRHAKAGAKRRGVDELAWYRSPGVVQKPMAKIVKEAGITEISAHSLRRTWENLLRAAGVDQLVRRALAGWRSERAQEIYATVAKEERDAAGTAIVDLVRGEKGLRVPPQGTPDSESENASKADEANEASSLTFPRAGDGI